MARSLTVYHRIPKDILAIIEPIVTDHGLGLVDVAVHDRGGAGRGLLRVYIDWPGGVDLDRCAELSRELERALDVAERMQGSYVLEVSSPGVDRRLGREEDFRAHTGETAVVRTVSPMEGRRNFSGKIVGLREGALILLEEGDEATQSVSVPFAEIEEANLRVVGKLYPSVSKPPRARRSRKAGRAAGSGRGY